MIRVVSVAAADPCCQSIVDPRRGRELRLTIEKSSLLHLSVLNKKEVLGSRSMKNQAVLAISFLIEVIRIGCGTVSQTLAILLLLL